MGPTLINGNKHSDTRGSLLYNNDFDVSAIKRMYFLENTDTTLLRGWQGHKIEQRWFIAVQGSFCIKLVKIDNWEKPSIELVIEEFTVESKMLDVLKVPKGYISCILALEEGSKLLAMSDYLLGEIKDEYRFDLNHFAE
jgi:hypothetical protein